MEHPDAAGLPAQIARLQTERGARSVVVPSELPPEWLSTARVRRVADSPGLASRELDAVGSVVTGCAVAIAMTGTIALDGGPDQGGGPSRSFPTITRVVRVPAQVVDSVPQALERLIPDRPLKCISGPSATSDIELSGVEGVHGPRTLEVVLVGRGVSRAGRRRGLTGPSGRRRRQEV